MGKLAELWAELKQQKDGARKTEIQQEINKIETWMIEQGYKKDQPTNWNKPELAKNKSYKASNKKYRFEDSRMGNYGMEEGDKTGNERCKACIWNKHTWCNPKKKPCWANV